jgi:hypothetical protein
VILDFNVNINKVKDVEKDLCQISIMMDINIKGILKMIRNKDMDLNIHGIDFFIKDNLLKI